MDCRRTSCGVTYSSFRLSGCLTVEHPRCPGVWVSVPIPGGAFTGPRSSEVWRATDPPSCSDRDKHLTFLEGESRQKPYSFRSSRRGSALTRLEENPGVGISGTFGECEDVPKIKVCIRVTVESSSWLQLSEREEVGGSWCVFVAGFAVCLR